MISVWAMIQNGVVINTVIASDTDNKYAPYTWVNLTGLTCTDGTPITIGCTTTDNVTFTPIAGN